MQKNPVYVYKKKKSKKIRVLYRKRITLYVCYMRGFLFLLVATASLLFSPCWPIGFFLLNACIIIIIIMSLLRAPPRQCPRPETPARLMRIAIKKLLDISGYFLFGRTNGFRRSSCPD